MYRVTLTVTALAFLATSPALADRRSEALTSHAVINNGGDANRLLFKASA